MTDSGLKVLGSFRYALQCALEWNGRNSWAFCREFGVSISTLEFKSRASRVQINLCGLMRTERWSD